MADEKKMSVADILAAARKADGDGAAPNEQDSSPAPAEATPAATTTSSSASAPKAAAKSSAGGRPSVAEMMALARAEKSGGGQAVAEQKAAPQKPAAKKPAAKPAAAKASTQPAEPRDTASILAAARKSTKAGPMSKAEAAAKQKADPIKTKPKPVVPPMPEKPAYAMAKPAAKGKAEKTDEERRSFLGSGFWLLGGATALWTLACVKFMFPNVLREPPSKFKVGPPDAFPAGQVNTKFKAEFAVWIANAEYNGEQQIYALRSVCTHLGCTPNWLEAEQKFKCPCHGSGFYKDGINFEGPAPRPLERYAIRIAADGQIEVDRSRLFFEEKGEWSDPASFIPV